MEIDIKKAREKAHESEINSINRVLVFKNYSVIKQLRKEGYSWSSIEHAIKQQIENTHPAFDKITQYSLRRNFNGLVEEISKGTVKEEEFEVSRPEIQHSKPQKKGLFGGYSSKETLTEKEAIEEDQEAIFINKRNQALKS